MPSETLGDVVAALRAHGADAQTPPLVRRGIEILCRAYDCTCSDGPCANCTACAERIAALTAALAASRCRLCGQAWDPNAVTDCALCLPLRAALTPKEPSNAE